MNKNNDLDWKQIQLDLYAAYSYLKCINTLTNFEEDLVDQIAIEIAIQLKIMFEISKNCNLQQLIGAESKLIRTLYTSSIK